MKGEFDIGFLYGRNPMTTEMRSVIEYIMKNCPVITVPENPSQRFKVTSFGRLNVSNPGVTCYALDPLQARNFSEVKWSYCGQTTTHFLDYKTSDGMKIGINFTYE